MRILFFIALVIVLAIIFVPEDKMRLFLEEIEEYIKDLLRRIISYTIDILYRLFYRIFNFFISIARNIWDEIRGFILEKVETEKIDIIENTWNWIKNILIINKEVNEE